MTSSAPLSCAVCSVKFEDLDLLLQHMAGHTASTPASAAPATAGKPANARQIVLSQTAFLRLKPILQQSASKSVVTIVTQSARGRRRPIRPRPSVVQDPVESLDVEVIEPTEPTDSENNECRVCRRRFKHKYSLVAHCRQHLMSRICGVCHQRQTDGQALVNHLETHMEKNSTFKCDQCDKSFVHAKSLYVHKRNHSGVRPYTCQYCFKTFRHWHKHRVHVRIHTGERPYRCDVCGWGFPRNDERKRHMRTHIGCKAFHCIDCGVGCGTQVALMRHQELHHGKGATSAVETLAVSAEPVTQEEQSAEGEEHDENAPIEAEENFDDLDEEITVKIEMDGSGEDGRSGNDGDEGDEGEEGENDSDDPPYRPDSDADSDATADSDQRAASPARAARPVARTTAADAATAADDDNIDSGPLPDPTDDQPQRDPIAIDEPKRENPEESYGAPVFIKTEPKDPEDAKAAEEEGGGSPHDPWDSDSDAELDAASAHLLEPEVNLTEMFIDIERMRSTIRRKIAANAHKFDDAVARKARLFVRDPEPNIDNMKSILRTKLEEGKRIQALLARNEAEKRRLQDEIEESHKKFKVEPVETYGDAAPKRTEVVASPKVVAKTTKPHKQTSRMRVRRLAPAVAGVGRHWLSGRLPTEEGDPGRTSDPSATPRVPRRRWIQHELNFTPDEGTLAEEPPPGGVRMSTGFGEL